MWPFKKSHEPVPVWYKIHPFVETGDIFYSVKKYCCPFMDIHSETLEIFKTRKSAENYKKRMIEIDRT